MVRKKTYLVFSNYRKFAEIYIPNLRKLFILKNTNFVNVCHHYFRDNFILILQ